MYTHFFHLNQAPFSIAPDPRYLFMSERHREALAHLLYGVNSGGGFVLLTGEIGAGKTTICRCFLEQIPANCKVAYIFNPKLTVIELLQSICDEFGIQHESNESDGASVKHYVDALNAYLLATHADAQNNVLIIDEAQNLSADVLEQLRLLTNLETNERKLLQIILIGQPELRTLLAKPELEQLAQRVIARYHLGSLSVAETAHYVLHRLAVAGLTTISPFQPNLLRTIHRITDGVPRRINLLCDRALLGAYAENKHEIDLNILKKAAREIFAEHKHDHTSAAAPWRYAWLGLATGAIIVSVTIWIINQGLLVKTVPAKKPVAASIPAQINQATQANQNQPLVPVFANLKDAIDSTAQDEHLAYQQLAKSWNVSLPAGDPCQAALSKDLHCYKSNRGLAEIRQLDRPVILVLHEGDRADNITYAQLVGLNNARASLRIGDTLQSASLVELGRRFRGEFITFWRAPKTFREKIVDADHGPEVDWIAAQLAKINGMPAPILNQTYDQTMSKLVKEFQTAQGLAADGVAGPKTFMNLNSAAGVDEPHLQGSAVPASTSPVK